MLRAARRSSSLSRRPMRPASSIWPLRGVAVAAHPAGRGHPCLERHRPMLPVARIVALAHSARRQGADRRLPGGAAHASRRAGARLRFLCLFRPQGVRADRHRRAVRTRRCCWRRCRPGKTGGGMILNVEIDHTEFQEPPHRFEAGTPDIAGAVGLGHRDRLHRGARPRRDPRARGPAHRLRRRPPVPPPGRASVVPRRAAAAQGPVLRPRRRASARCRHRARPARRRGQGRPSLRAAADGQARPRRHRARLARGLQRRSAISTAWPRRSRRAGRCSRR